ncbi:GNAT family N-acetyltransferase [Tabrizicola sp. TH137]|uniref:GNAT family N-acetyltransferase n=1 Tax=Tabrizicola sp. TH137 TaxID=2067452 RepID=UPI001C1F7842|nr:GNAT family N-acetyltransferase [Tabrizicola sp. TH137]
MTYRLAQDDMGGPVLWTERLCLRRPRREDIPASYAFWSSERSALMGGPWSMETLVAETEGLFAQWDKHGFSLFTVCRKGEDSGIGGIGPFFPETHPEPELGWSLWNAADEGQGLALEAARAARDWFFASSSYRTAVSYTDPANARSHRLCERLGAVVDATAPHPYGDEPTLTYRHFAGGRA